MSIVQIKEPSQSIERPIAVGIDFGTTNSIVAVVENEQINYLASKSNSVLLPSIVHYCENKFTVGEDAKPALQTDGQNTIYSVKRLLGHGLQDIGPQYQELQFVGDSTNPNIFKISTKYGDLSPVEISSHIFSSLLKRVIDAGHQGTEAVVTVPAYFDDAKRQAIKDAASIAGITVLRLLNEPTAAAYAYGLDNQADGTCLVYDLGGGTFDVSILQLKEGIFKVIATAGDPALGGDDFDVLLMQWLQEQLQLSSNQVDYNLLKQAAITAKHQLSEQQEAEVIYNKHIIKVSRQQYNNLIMPLLQKTLKICARALSDAQLTTADIDNVICVGGSTKDPFIVAEIKQYFSKQPLCSLDPERVVAQGAALLASMLSGHSKQDNILLDVIPLSLGVEVMGGLVEKILLRNTPIPAIAKQQFTTYQDGQTGIDFHVLQGERELASDCRSLARFSLSGFKPQLAGQVKVEVCYQVDADGLLTVTSKDLDSNLASTIEVKPTYGLKEQDVLAMIKQSVDNASHDIMQKKLALSKLTASQLITTVHKAIAEDSDLLAASELEEIKKNLQVLDTLINSNDIQQLNQTIDLMNDQVKGFMQKRLERVMQQAMAAPN